MRSTISEHLTVLAAIVVLSAAAPARSQTLDINTRVTLNIPSQSLEASLLELSRQAAFQLIISSATIPSRVVPAISGDMPIKAAVEHVMDHAARRTEAKILHQHGLGERTCIVER